MCVSEGAAERKRGLKGCNKKRFGSFTLFQNLKYQNFIALRIFMTKKKPSLPFNISSFWLSCPLPVTKGWEKEGKDRQDWRMLGPILTTHHHHQGAVSERQEQMYREDL